MELSALCSISVVVPVYNREKTIAYCIQSILKQTYSPNEIIIVDDCSTDNTKELVSEYIKNSPQKIKYFCLEKKSGAQAARNMGISMANGNWVAFLDSDDEWLANKLELQLEFLKEMKYDPMIAIYTDCYIDKLGHREIWSLPHVSNTQSYNDLLISPGPMFQGMLVSKEALKRINYLDEKVPSYQEWDTAISLAKHCSFFHMRTPLFVYHLHEGETISKNPQRDIAGYQYIITKFKEEIINLCGHDIWLKHLENQVMRCVRFRLWPLAKEQLKMMPSCMYWKKVLLSLIIQTQGRGMLILRVYEIGQQHGIIFLLKKLIKKLRKVMRLE